jgi:hypothetical protein
MKRNLKILPFFFLIFFVLSCEAQNKKINVSSKDFATLWNSSDGQMMNEQNFWKVINAMRHGVSLKLILNDRTPNELVQFMVRFDSLKSTAYDFKLWGAAYVINGGCSDDCFDDFEESLIKQGRKYFYEAVKNPDNLADLMDEQPFDSEIIANERIPYIIYTEYQRKTGNEPPRLNFVKYKLKGERFDEDTVRKNYPKLAKKY